MKKILKICLFIVLLISLTGCNEQNNSSNDDALRFKEEYEALNNQSVVMEINEENPIKYVDFEEVIDLLTNGTGVIYFGFSGCPWCRNMLPVLFDVATNNNIDKVYYFNPSNIRKSDDENYQKLTNLLDNYLLENEEGKKTLYVPDVYFVKDGQIVGHHLSTVDSQIDPFVSLTEEQTNELKEIYQNLFKKIK